MSAAIENCAVAASRNGGRATKKHGASRDITRRDGAERIWRVDTNKLGVTEHVHNNQLWSELSCLEHVGDERDVGGSYGAPRPEADMRAPSASCPRPAQAWLRPSI